MLKHTSYFSNIYSSLKIQIIFKFFKYVQWKHCSIALWDLFLCQQHQHSWNKLYLQQLDSFLFLFSWVLLWNRMVRSLSTINWTPFFPLYHCVTCLVQILFFLDAEINLPIDVERYRFISWTFCLAGVTTIIPWMFTWKHA